MKKTLATIGGIFAVMLMTASACDSSNQDLQQPKAPPIRQEANVVTVQPDEVRIIQNIDGHPTLVLVCYEGVAHMTVSDAHLAGDRVFRVKDWDWLCRDARN